MITTLISVTMFVLFIWLPMYMRLRDDSKYINGFILLLPVNLLRDNQYLRSLPKAAPQHQESHLQLNAQSWGDLNIF